MKGSFGSSDKYVPDDGEGLEHLPTLKSNMSKEIEEELMMKQKQPDETTSKKRTKIYSISEGSAYIVESDRYTEHMEEFVDVVDVIDLEYDSEMELDNGSQQKQV